MAKHLTSEQRCEIYLGSKRRWSKSRIAREIDVHPLTVSCELRRNCNTNGKRFGDWEMDTIVDSYGHAILTLTERSTNFIIMERLKHGRKAMPAVLTAARMLYPYRSTLRTITTDNGCEFAAHQEITRRLSMRNREQVIAYFADSYSSWQKGAIENANKFIRRYITKKSNFEDFTDRRIREIQKKINRRPREKLNFDTPLKCFFKHFE